MINFFLENESGINIVSWAIMIFAMIGTERILNRKIYFFIEVLATIAFSVALFNVIINILNKGF